MVGCSRSFWTFPRASNGLSGLNVPDSDLGFQHRVEPGLIFNAVRSAVRFGFRPNLERFKGRGMKSTEADIALGRKLIRIAFALLTNRERFDPNRLKIARLSI